MNRLIKSAAIVSAGAVSAVGLHAGVKELDAYGSPNQNSKIELCAQSLGQTAVRTQELPANCLTLESLFAYQQTVTRTFDENQELVDSKKSPKVYLIPSPQKFRDDNLESPQDQSRQDRFDWILSAGGGVIMSGFFALAYRKRPEGEFEDPYDDLDDEY